MPLTEEERQRLHTIRQSGMSPNAQMPSTVPPGLPPDIAALVAPSTTEAYQATLSPRGGTMTVPPPASVAQDKLKQRLAELQLRQRYPVPTEMERERVAMTKSTMEFLDDFANELGIDESSGTVKHARELALTRDVFDATGVGRTVQDYAQGPKTKKIYSALDSAFTLGALTLTGRQGDVQKLKQLQDLYRFGNAIQGQPEVIIDRFKKMKKLFMTFDKKYTTDAERVQQNQHISKEMDGLLRSADPKRFGGELRVDKYGRKAYVFPDGTFEVVK